MLLPINMWPKRFGWSNGESPCSRSIDCLKSLEDRISLRTKWLHFALSMHYYPQYAEPTSVQRFYREVGFSKGAVGSGYVARSPVADALPGSGSVQ